MMAMGLLRWNWEVSLRITLDHVLIFPGKELLVGFAKFTKIYDLENEIEIGHFPYTRKMWPDYVSFVGNEKVSFIFVILEDLVIYR